MEVLALEFWMKNPYRAPRESLANFDSVLPKEIVDMMFEVLTHTIDPRDVLRLLIQNDEKNMEKLTEVVEYALEGGMKPRSGSRSRRAAAPASAPAPSPAPAAAPQLSLALAAPTLVLTRNSELKLRTIAYNVYRFGPLVVLVFSFIAVVYYYLRIVRFQKLFNDALVFYRYLRRETGIGDNVTNPMYTQTGIDDFVSELLSFKGLFPEGMPREFKSLLAQTSGLTNGEPIRNFLKIFKSAGELNCTDIFSLEGLCRLRGILEIAEPEFLRRDNFTPYFIQVIVYMISRLISKPAFLDIVNPRKYGVSWLVELVVPSILQGLQGRFFGGDAGYSRNVAILCLLLSVPIHTWKPLAGFEFLSLSKIVGSYYISRIDLSLQNFGISLDKTKTFASMILFHPMIKPNVEWIMSLLPAASRLLTGGSTTSFRRLLQIFLIVLFLREGYQTIRLISSRECPSSLFPADRVACQDRMDDFRKFLLDYAKNPNNQRDALKIWFDCIVSKQTEATAARIQTIQFLEGQLSINDFSLFLQSSTQETLTEAREMAEFLVYRKLRPTNYNAWSLIISDDYEKMNTLAKSARFFANEIFYQQKRYMELLSFFSYNPIYTITEFLSKFYNVVAFAENSGWIGFGSNLALIAVFGPKPIAVTDLPSTPPEIADFSKVAMPMFQTFDNYLTRKLFTGFLELPKGLCLLIMGFFSDIFSIFIAYLIVPKKAFEPFLVFKLWTRKAIQFVSLYNVLRLSLNPISRFAGDQMFSFLLFFPFADFKSLMSLIPSEFAGPPQIAQASQSRIAQAAQAAQAREEEARIAQARDEECERLVGPKPQMPRGGAQSGGGGGGARDPFLEYQQALARWEEQCREIRSFFSSPRAAPR